MYSYIVTIVGYTCIQAIFCCSWSDRVWNNASMGYINQNIKQDDYHALMKSVLFTTFKVCMDEAIRSNKSRRILVHHITWECIDQFQPEYKSIY